MNKNFAGYLSALLATTVWAGNFVAARGLAEIIPPIQFNFWRWALALVVMLPFAWPHLKNDWQVVRHHFGYFSLLALLGVTLMNTFVYKGGQSSSSLSMALIMTSTPAVIMLIARFMYGEPFFGRRILGMCLSTCGIVILLSNGSMHRLLAIQFQAGDIWTLGCMICFALYSLIMRKRPQDISAAGFNFFVFGIGLVYALPMLTAEMYYMPLPKPGWVLLSGVAYAGLGCSALAFWLWTVAIDKIGPVRSSLIYYSLPFFAALMGKIVLNENIYPAQIWGGFLIIGGIVLASILPKRKGSHAN